MIIEEVARADWFSNVNGQAPRKFKVLFLGYYILLELPFYIFWLIQLDNEMGFLRLQLFASKYKIPN